MKFYKMISEDLLFKFSEEEEKTIINILEAMYKLSEYYSEHIIIGDIIPTRTVDIASSTGKKTYTYKVNLSHKGSANSKTVFLCHIDNLDTEPRCLVQTFITSDWIEQIKEAAERYPLSTSFA